MTKKETSRGSLKTSQITENSVINVYDDELMINLGIRPPHIIPRDIEVWAKTSYEKRVLRSERCKHKERIHFHSVPRESIPVRAKLIIYLKKNKKFPNTVYSTECWQHEIGDILLNYIDDKKSELLVTKYSYNGKTYKPEERPFWR